ncbi:MAG: ATP-binding cassette domain-containing protein [Methylomonas sp.]|jgi:NitT/TauT family transport system ATP-binding protein|uniref:ABC transporter ATP-binding protein n=1 Tax=Methylomonas sp. TaxID=418 RepID=UPI0025EF8D14|nr:ATP-binding cassette domain-containing protein [Methylomonas sp.]MCK9607101.1 ATP-binding cassette domain-containing protein [Methylomonas sp.]
MSDIRIHISNKTYVLAHDTAQFHHAIAELDFIVHPHQFVCLVGPSGCGKTTLLNMIAGLDQHYQGRIDMGQADKNPSIGYVFQNPRLLPWLSVRQNIEVVFDRTPPANLIDSLLDSMQLREAQHQYPERLSLGMQRRVAIIRAFAINPDILLMDEPFVSLDAPTARQVRSLLYSLWLQRPHTVLFVTHDLREAIALADRVIFLSPSPMQVLSDITVPIARDQRHEESRIEIFREHLLQNHPEIKGLL